MLSTRQRILDEAIGLFLSGGYAAGSLRMIADRVGITQAAVYYHFRAKDELLAELLEPPLAGYETLLDAAEARRDAEHTVDRRALVGAVLDHLREHRDVVRLVESDVVVQRHPRWESRMAQARHRCIALLAGPPTGPDQATGRWEIDPADEVLAAAALAVLIRPVVRCTEWHDGTRELLLDAAVRVLDTPHRGWSHHTA